MRTKSAGPEVFTQILRENGHKATPSRISLLEVLSRADRPLTTQEIMKRMDGKINQATIYRSLETLIEVSVVRQIDMQHGHAHYEILSGTKHHHHLICKTCGQTEDVAKCDISRVERSVLKKSQHFATIKDHSLEFFGQCKKCAHNHK